MKYNTSQTPRIDVRTRSQRGGVTVDIVDNGGGITREEANMVFEKFARGNRADRDHGAGLGLPISRAIMRAMEGDLTAEFAPDGTSFFRIRLQRER